MTGPDGVWGGGGVSHARFQTSIYKSTPDHSSVQVGFLFGFTCHHSHLREMGLEQESLQKINQAMLERVNTSGGGVFCLREGGGGVFYREG